MQNIDKIISEMSLEEKITLCGCGLNLSSASLVKNKISLALPKNILASRENLSGLGCSFDLELASLAGKIIGGNAIKNGEDLAGVLNLGVIREPMRAGSEKMLSEDPLVCSEMANAMVSSCPIKMLASGVLGGEYPFVERNIDTRALMELYLRPFITLASKLGGLVLPAGSINGEMACESSFFINKILQFMPNGVIINEFGSVINCENSLKSGALFVITDDKNELSKLYDLVKNGKIEEKLLDKNIARILNFALNLVDKKPIEDININDYKKRLVEESIVLLKNDTQLPLLSKKSGSPADVTKPKVANSADVTKPKVGIFGDITKAEAGIFTKELDISFKKYGDYPAIVLLRLAGEKYTAQQEKMVDSALANCSSVIVILLAPRPAPLAFEGEASAILYAPVFNEFTFEALSKIIVGKLNPCGKLNVSYAYSPLDYPAQNYYKTSERGMFCHESVMNGYRYFNSFSRSVLYPFGHGLSYTGFDISDLKLSCENETLLLDFTIRNVGTADGGTTLFVFGNLYGENVFGLRSRLAGFKRVHLKKGEQNSTHMAVNLNSFSVYDEKNFSWIIPSGKIEIFVGLSALDRRVSGVCKLNFSAKLNSSLSVKEVPTYYAQGEFNPLGADVEKVMKTPLLVKNNPLEKYCGRGDTSRDNLIKTCAKKLVKTAGLKLVDATIMATNMSDYALKKFVKALK